MPAAPSSPHEKKRLEAVQRLKLMGTPAEERFDKITRLAKKLFDVPLAAIDIVGTKLAWLKSVQGFDGIEGLRKDSYCHHTILKDEINVICDAHQDARVCDSDFADTWVFYAGAPIHFDGERVGVLCIGDTKPRQLDAEQLNVLSDLAMLVERELNIAALSESQLALASSNEELEKKANIDVLTHAWNRGAILNIAGNELSQASSKNSIALLMIDIDFYKHINDTFGHCAGDQVLRETAERLRRSIRSKDAIGRYGGDEFLAVLTNINTHTALQISQKICEEISNNPVIFEKYAIVLTCSIGCTISHGADDLLSLIRRADQALYQAKTTGRNHIELK